MTVSCLVSRQDLRVHGAVPGVAAALGAASRTPAREPGMPRTAGAGTEKRGKHEQKNEVSFGKHEKHDNFKENKRKVKRKRMDEVKQSA